jgi:hypothetical protein
MDILLNDVLIRSAEEIDNSKIEFNMQAGSGGQSFIDRWHKHYGRRKSNRNLSRLLLLGLVWQAEKLYPGKLCSAFRECQQISGFLFRS